VAPGEPADQAPELVARRQEVEGERTLQLATAHLEVLEPEDPEPDTGVDDVAGAPAEVAERVRGHVPSVDGGEPPATAGRVPSPVVVTAPETSRAPADDGVDAVLDDPLGPAPAVVVTLVAHDPGWWFEETLESVAAQDYPNVSVLVVDAGSADPAALRSLVATVLPDAHLRRLDTDPGFAAAADEVLTAVQGAAFHLFCHDDVRLAPDAVRVLVEEAYRSNAGVVGPKLVEWTDPRRLLSVGMGADRFGQPVPYVERGDLDQAQHDAVRDAFFVPGAATLVRADLFDALGGFDRAMAFHGEDLDLCWRAHVAGARVVVAPAARVAHLEALGVRRPVDDRRRLQQRHRLRAMRASDSFGTRLRTVPIAFVLALMEVVQSLALGRLRHARDIASAWTWNLRHAGSTRRRRQQLAAVRQVPDRDVRALHSRGSARLSGFVRAQIGRDESAGRRRDFVSNLRASKATTSVVLWVLIAAYLLVGSRELLFGGGDIPAVGGFQVFLSPGQMLSRWVSGYQAVGLGSTAPAPTGFGLFGGLGVVLFGAVGVLRKVLILGLWPLGAVGLWRLTKPVGSRRARLVATIAYVVIPVPANAMAEGRWGALAAYAAIPWVVGQLASASALAPFGEVGGSAGPGVRHRPLVQRVVAVGVVTALAAVIEPSVVVVVVGCAVALVVGGLLVGQVAGAGRVLVVGIGGAVVAAVLQLPWSLGALDGWDAVVGTTSTSGYALDLSNLLRFGDGPFGSGATGWAILVTAALPLLIGRRWRLGWAVRGWALAAAGFAVAWVAGQGWLDAAFPSPDVVLVPASVGVALAAGLGMAAFEVDLPDYHFGWRQIVSLLAGAGFVLALLPGLGMALSGRWDLPRGDYDTTLSFLDDDEAQPTQSRVLWLGDASAVPLGGWALDAPNVDDLGDDRTLVFATSSDGTPTIAQHWAGDEGAATEVESALQVAADGGTTRLGALLAPMAVRYVVVPLAPAPDPYARDTTFVPSDLLAVLDGQLDLDAVTVNPGIRVYRNAAYAPSRALLAAGTELPGGGDALADRLVPELTGAPAVLPDADGFADWTGSIDQAGELYVSSAGSRWSLEVDGVEAPRSDALGWASTFAVDQPGDARLRFDTPPTRWLALAGQVVLWVLALVYLLRVRVREDEGMELPAAVPAPEAPPEAPAHVVIRPELDEVLARISEDSDLPTMAVPAVSLDEPEPSRPSRPDESDGPDGSVEEPTSGRSEPPEEPR
jgi:GT2 family glycosyltransferase